MGESMFTMSHIIICCITQDNELKAKLFILFLQKHSEVILIPMLEHYFPNF